MRTIRERACTSLTFLLFAVAGCGSENSNTKVPQASDVQAALEEVLGQAIERGRIEINSVKKVDGQVYEMRGESTYSVKYELVVTYPNGLNSFENRVEKGGTKTIIDSMVFEQMESGWVASPFTTSLQNKLF